MVGTFLQKNSVELRVCCLDLEEVYLEDEAPL